MTVRDDMKKRTPEGALFSVQAADQMIPRGIRTASRTATRAHSVISTVFRFFGSRSGM